MPFLRGGNVFKHRVKMGAETNQYTVEDATLPSKQSQLTKAFDSVYPRYTGHFVIADLQLLLLACMFGIIAFRVGKSWFEILVLNASAPLMGFQDLRTNQRLKEVMQAIQGSFIAVFAEMIGLRVFLIALDYLGSANNPGVAFLKQYPNSALPIWIFLVLMYLACFMGFMTGVSMIERWTGVPQSKNGIALGTLMGLGLGLNAAGKGIKAGAKGVGMVREGMQGFSQKRADGLTGKAVALPDPTKATQAKDQQQTNQTTGKPTMVRADQSDQPNSNQQQKRRRVPKLVNYQWLIHLLKLHLMAPRLQRAMRLALPYQYQRCLIQPSRLIRNRIMLKVSLYQIGQKA